MGFDISPALRKLKPQRRKAPLQRRSDRELHWASDEPLVGSPLLLDTSVYFDALQGRTPKAVDELLTYRACHHSAVCLAELTHAFGRLDPSHPLTKTALKAIRETIEDIPDHRLYAPRPGEWAEAGILAGEAARLTGAAKGDVRRLLNDALIFVQARGLGAGVLSGNISDFDILDQLSPGVRVVFYRRQEL